jgi:ubiquinol-cytochrome c reductase cytochrome b subunit
MTWAGRIGLLIGPPLAYWVTVRICLGLQQHDREVLTHGIETGIIRRLPDGGFAEVHQQLDGAAPLPYAGWTVPKKMNRIGALGPAVKGFFVPVERPAAAQPPPVIAAARERAEHNVRQRAEHDERQRAEHDERDKRHEPPVTADRS